MESMDCKTTQLTPLKLPVMTTLRTMIVEDEHHAQQLLTHIIEDYCPMLSVVGHAANVSDGIQAINNLKPDLVFFDVELGVDRSFEILNQVEHSTFQIIFTTAHDKYAFQAFQYEAIDYILKPYVPKDVIKAIEKVKKANRIEGIFHRFESLTKRGNSPTRRIPIPTNEGLTLIHVKDIIRIVADRAYCKIYSTDNQKLFATKSLGEVETLLPPSTFFRTHTSHLINLDYVKKYIKEDGGSVVMDDDSHVPLSRRRKTLFLSML